MTLPALAAAAIAAGCSAAMAPGPRPDPPATPPALSAEPPAFGERLEETSLVREVLVRNPTLHAMREALRAARARPPQVTALEDPHLAYVLAPDSIGSRRVDFAQKIDLSQKLPWPGRLSTRGEAALREADAAGEDLEGVRLRLVEAVREAFSDWWYVHRALAIYEKNQELLGELRQIAEVRYSAALASKQDALHAEVEYQQLLHRGVVLRRMREVTLTRLNTLLDLPAKAALPPPVPLAAPGPVPPREDLEAQAVERRPILRAQRMRIENRKAALRLAELEFFPSFTVTGAYDGFWDAEELRPMIGVGINVPIQLERRRAAVSEARARLRQAESILEEKRLEVLEDLHRAYDELLEHQHVVRLYEGSVLPAADESLAAARSGYESGTNDFLTVMQAEKALLTAELTRERGIAEVHKARARLERAAGTPLRVEDER